MVASTFSVAGLGTFGLVACEKVSPLKGEKPRVTVHVSDEERYKRLMDHVESMGLALIPKDVKMPLFKATFTREEAEFLARFPFLPKSPEALAARYDMPVDALLEKLKPYEKRAFVQWTMVDGERHYVWDNSDNILEFLRTLI